MLCWQYPTSRVRDGPADPDAAEGSEELYLPFPKGGRPHALNTYVYKRMAAPTIGEGRLFYLT